ncbi:threonine aldolase family protein [Methylovirgula sp. 4M-Z18]|uniref:threonine aldolase family protein n=1 Tax=Methylovirgula sp. 4M-Z18 TaxID=2293567 RepID=UPI000E2EB9AA|nr:low specificity L-threonine aldolase [Methylovirgula sp. 4M-Z18]RFB78544.1 low specificity L-threonine aldolase [Methylovirgula sp. 4M-Z18]
MDFASDNAAGASRKILDALIEANSGTAAAYGADSYTKRAEDLLKDIFARDVKVFLVSTGTAANALALSALTPPWGTVFCHEDGHIFTDECGAPELFTGGAKLAAIGGADGKITPEALEAAIAHHPRGFAHVTQPAALSLSQATECGTIYNVAEVQALTAVARAHGLRVHMDGARFANALMTLGCSPADITWKAGVDVLCFGATKNGALACEAVIFFDPALADAFLFRRKRAGHTLSKGRYLGAQMAAYLADDHWLHLATKANAAAKRLAEGLEAAGIGLVWPRQANEVFAQLPAPVHAALQAAGAIYHPWTARCLTPPPQGQAAVRLVTSFATSLAEIDRFLAVVRENLPSSK